MNGKRGSVAVAYFGAFRRGSDPAFDVDAHESDDDGDGQNDDARIVAHKVRQNRQEGHFSIHARGNERDRMVIEKNDKS